MLKKRNNSGFTMAETLVVVALVAILSGLSFVGVLQIQRSLAQTECDAVAKEIFVAAQNHLTMAESQGYLGVADFGKAESTDNAESIEGQKSQGVYYFIVNGEDSFTGNTVLDLMLPFASIEEGARTGGSYIIRYQSDPAQVLDVFYCYGASTRFGHKFTEDEYSKVLALRDGEGGSKKAARRAYGNDKAVVGWYGGTEALSLEKGEPIKTPAIQITNGDRLYVTVTDPNDSNIKASLRLIITGEQSSKNGKKSYITLAKESAGNITYNNGVYTVILDDITAEDMHFCELFGSDELIPGENISVQAVAYSNSVLTNIAYSAEKTTNSLFADGTTETTAQINNFRHLENLDAGISNLDLNDTQNALNIAEAKQSTDLNWTTFRASINNTALDSVCVYHNDSASQTEGGKYWPASSSVAAKLTEGTIEKTPYALAYDGQGHSISNVVVNTDEAAGMFGALAAGSSVSNLMLIDFDVTSASGPAGALAGKTVNTDVTNVVAYEQSASRPITATSGSAGGLIGSADGGIIKASAASVIVSGGSAAGGLIGTAGETNETLVVDCYSGGHTTGGAYSATYNVTATSGVAGGLIGSANSSVITSSYSTCSVSGATAGGLVGTADGQITNCYATGLVSGAISGAFAGVLPENKATACYYYEIINGADGGAGYVYLGPVGDAAYSGITALDTDLSTYASFFENAGTGTASVYDTTLSDYYGGKYFLKTVYELDSTLTSGYFVAVHYGDWPAPEIFFFNTEG